MTFAYERVLDALRGIGLRVHEHGGRSRAQCPGHQSRGLTLLVSQRDDAAGVHCFGGCDIVDVLALLGLALRDLFDDNAGHPPSGWTPRPALSPLGTPDHFCDRILQQERLDTDPAYQARRATELADALAARPGDYKGAGRG